MSIMVVMTDDFTNSFRGRSHKKHVLRRFDPGIMLILHMAEVFAKMVMRRFFPVRLTAHRIPHY
jgi:hypothetical protein